MKERFLERIDSLIKSVLDMPPSYEEVAANFVHGKNCRRSKPLRKIELEQIINVPDAGMWGMGMHSVTVTQKYVKCDECQASVRHSG